jgi:hypothetical protein
MIPTLSEMVHSDLVGRTSPHIRPRLSVPDDERCLRVPIRRDHRERGISLHIRQGFCPEEHRDDQPVPTLSERTSLAILRGKFFPAGSSGLRDLDDDS